MAADGGGVAAWRTCASAFNPYPQFSPSRFLWPRGFPLELIHDCSSVVENLPRVAEHRVPMSRIAVVQVRARSLPPSLTSLLSLVECA